MRHVVWDIGLAVVALTMAAGCGGTGVARSSVGGDGGVDAALCKPGAARGCAYGGPASAVNNAPCRPGSQICQADGIWSACAGEIDPKDETCDGVDDDCDGVVDNGCPIVGSAPREGVGQGTVGSFGVLAAQTKFSDSCAGAVTGFHGQGNFALDGIGLYCGDLSIAQSKDQSYAIKVAPAMAFASKGGTGGTAFDAPCPADEVVTSVSFTIASPPWSTLFGMQFTCAPFAVRGKPGAFSFKQLPATMQSEKISGNCSGVSGGCATQSFTCPADSYVVAIDGYFGPWPQYTQYTVVNGITIYCATGPITVPLIAAK